MERGSKKVNWAKELGKSLPAIALVAVGAQGNASVGSSRSRLRTKAWINSTHIHASPAASQKVFNGFSSISAIAKSSSSSPELDVGVTEVDDNPDLKDFLKQLKKKKKTRNSLLSGDTDAFRSDNPNFIGKTKASGTCSPTGLFSYCTSATSQSCTTDADCNFGGNNVPTNIGLDNSSIGDASTGAGAVIGNLSTTDADGGDTHTYSLVNNGVSGSGSCGASGDDDNASFQVDNANDDLETAGSVTAGSYNVCIQTHDGTDSYQKTFAITVTDTTAPSFENSTPSVGTLTLTGGTVSIDLDEEGTAYYVVVADGAGAPSANQVKAGQDSGGGAPLADGSFATVGTTGSEAFSGLSSGTAYDLYAVAEDDEGSPNLQASSTLVNFTTNSPDSDGDLIASGTVSEPVGLDTTVDMVGEAVDVFDFTLSDGGSADGYAMTVSQIVVNVSGTSTDTERGNITWRLNGNDASDVAGVYSAGADTITFSGLSISIADGASETYTVNAYYNDNTNITEDHTVILSVDGGTDVTVGGSGTGMGATSAVTNGTGTTMDVTATALVFTTQPASSTSGSALATQPVVAAQDAFGNTDVDFTETVTLTEASAGSLSGDVDIVAVSGVATFTDVAYSATADQQSFTLTANDEDGTGSNLSTVDANAVTSDVVATKLVFTTEPSPLTVNSGQATAFSTVPVVSAQDADNIVDTGYSTDITIAEVNGAGSATMTGTGDTDGNGSTVSITPSSGASTFTNLSITYTASGGSSETFNLQASSGGLTTADSSQLTGLVPDSDGDLTASGTVSEPVGLDTTVDTIGEAVDVFDFTLSDGGTSDGLAMAVSQIVINVSGTSTDTERGNITWRLNGNDAANVAGVYNAGADTITFSGLSISVADGGSETYTINAYYNDNSSITEDHTVILSVDGNSDLTVGGSGSSMGATSAVTNGSGTTLDVVVSTLAFTTQPSGSTSGSTLTTQPVLTAQDAFGNTDVDFTETVTLTEASAGSLSGDVDIAAVSGVATFTDLAYTATADQQSFTLTANDEDGTGSDLPTVDANAVTSDVVATKLAFVTQPSPLTVVSGVATAFTTVPVVAAQDADNVVDTGYSTDITLIEVNGAGSATMTATGDTDGNGATVSITPSSGVSTYTSLNITYTASGGASETFNLQASSGGLTTADSSDISTAIPPMATNDNATTDEDNAVAITVLSNDSADVGTLNASSVIVASAPTHGSTSVNTGSGVITYMPEADYSGADSFTYTVEDEDGVESNTATVNLTVNAVNDAPVAVADLASTTMDNLVSVNVAANDSDVDSGDAVDTATIAIVVTPGHGTAVVNSGEVDYTPTTGFIGTDYFTYTIDDENGATSNAVVVTVNVTGVNTLPTAVDDSPSVGEDSNVVIDVLANDSDGDGSLDATTVAVLAQPTHGSTSVNGANGEITYTPAADYNGSDSFTYTVQDDAGGTSNAGTVTVTINSSNDAPVAVDDTVYMQQVVAHRINVLGNDHDVDGSLDASSVQVVAAPGSGSTSIDTGTGSILYTPDMSFNISDSLTYRVQDNQGTWSSPATVTMTVQPVNDPPLANNDILSLNEDTATVLNILTNDSDTDGSLDVTTIAIIADVSNGSLVDNNDGTLTYTPDANSYGSDSFTYRVQDDSGDNSGIATVSLAVHPVNDAPTISGSPTTNVSQGDDYSFIPTLNDVDGDLVTVNATNLPGWLTLNSATGALSGTATIADTFPNIVLTATDGTASKSLAAFSISVGMDTDGDGTPDSTDSDDDDDGMSDIYESAHGLDPLDDSDAAGDLDGDNVSNLQEFLDNTDPEDPEDYTDTTAPVVVPPENLVVDATALFTPLTIRQLLGLPASASNANVTTALTMLARDNVDGDDCCGTQVPALLNGSVLLAPGINKVTYRAVDNKGNVGTATQTVNVRPLVSVNKDQVAVEGATVQFRVILSGQSPFYPLTIPYTIDSQSTADSSDHDLTAGTVTLTKSGNVGQTEASVGISLIDDGVTENAEVLIVKLDDRTGNAQDLANGYNASNPNIYDINSGAKTSHIITIATGNVAPDATLRLSQGGSNTIQVTADGGPVTVTATVTDPNQGDTQEYDWSASDSVLADTDGNIANSTLVFNPGALDVGRYQVEVKVTDSAGVSDSSRLYFRVVAALPTLDSSQDTDGDGVDDQSEGVADSDDDGIPDYLDNISASNVLPEVASETASYLLECDPGVRCRLGQFALMGATGGARLDAEDIVEQPDIMADADFDNVGGLFDFEIHELPTLGQSVRIVLPQQSPIPADGIYRKYQNGQWITFVEDADNALHSAAGNPGYCPPPGDEGWEPGLVEGYYCVQLTIEDGGPNDADGLENASVEDPGGVGVASGTVRTRGGGAIHWPILVVIFLGLILLNRSSYRKGTLISLLVVAGLVPSQPSHALDWDTENFYLTFAGYHANGSQDSGSFTNDLESDGIDVTLSEYDVSRLAVQGILGYRYHDMMALEIGFLDLGNVDVDLNAVSPSDEELSQALEDHYPVSGNGLTVANRFLWDITPEVTLSGEVGVFFWNGDIQLSGPDIHPDLDGGVDPLLGVGAGYHLNRNVEVLISAKRLFFNHQQVALLGVGAAFHF